VSPKRARKTLHPNLAGATSWTQRQLVFDAASLADVAEEFNRYNERKLVIEPSALETLHISGVFSSTDSASLIRFLRDVQSAHHRDTNADPRRRRSIRIFFTKAVTDCSCNALLENEPTKNTAVGLHELLRTGGV